MSIFIQILISLTTSIFVVLVCFLLRQHDYRKRKLAVASSLESLESQISDLTLKVANLEQIIADIPQTENVGQNECFPINNVETNARKRKQKRHECNLQQTNIQSPPQQEEKPKNANLTNFTLLSISEGKLVEVAFGQTSYYRAWRQKDKIFFEFFCDAQRIQKAINNRSAIIDPCCIKDDQSVEPDKATSIMTVRKGELDNNFNILLKAKIKFS